MSKRTIDAATAAQIRHARRMESVSLRSVKAAVRRDTETVGRDMHRAVKQAREELRERRSAPDKDAR